MIPELGENQAQIRRNKVVGVANKIKHPPCPLLAAPTLKGVKMKERDTTFPKLITKTKTKRYVVICPVSKAPIGPVFQFRIQASQFLQHHLIQKHQISLAELKENYE